MDYLEWNNHLAKHFFNEPNGGREVLIYVNENVINEVGNPFKADFSDFVRAVKGASNGKDICSRALDVFEGWRTKGFTYPPYIGFLSFFVLADTTDSDYAEHAYYPRLWGLLGEDEKSGTPYRFNKMLDLWCDLEEWSKIDRGEELGKFTARILGGWWKVGLPRSQTLLSEEEREKLPQLFSDAGLEPSDPPAPEALSLILLNCRPEILNECLRHRTQGLLKPTSTADAEAQHFALLDLLLDELASWNGLSQEQDEEELTTTYGAYFRLCIPELDVFSVGAEINLRVFAKRPFPDDPLHIKILNKQWIIKEYSQDWSKALFEDGVFPPKNFDAKVLNWEEGILTVDKDSGWKIRLLPGRIKLFLKGGKYGIKGWVESRRIEGNTDFLVACSQGEVGRVEKWGKDCCSSFSRFPLQGFPKGWLLFKGNKAQKSLQGVSCLTISNAIRLKLRGGIKTGLGNSYLNYALPDVLLENGTFFEGVEVFANEKRLKQYEKNNELWLLPDNLPLGQTVEIKTRVGEKEPRRYLRVVEPEIAKGIDSNPGKTPNGRTQEIVSGFAFARGPIIVGGEGIKDCHWKVYPTYLGESLSLIGSQSGQVAEWPHDPFPTTWSPVWAIVSTGKKEFELHYCGNQEDLLEKSLPTKKTVGKKEKDLKRWAEVIWFRRKVTKPPSLGVLKKLWAAYQAVAKNV